MDRRRRWQLAQDIALAVLVGVVGMAEVWLPFESVQGGGSLVVSTVGIVLCAAFLAFRRIQPWVLLGLPITWVVLGVVSSGELQLLFFGQLVPLYLALYSAARHGTARQAVIVCGSIFVSVVLADLTLPALQSPSELLFHWGAFLAVLAVGLGLRASEHRAVAAAVRVAKAEATAREAALRAVAEERTRIARELHDILGHSVSVMVVQAGAAAQAVDDDPQFVRRALEAIRTTGSQSLDEVRRVVALLREDGDSSFAPQPGLAQLPDLIAQARSDGIPVDLVETGTPIELSPGQELSIYRIVQESLTNVRKHAPGAATRVEVRFDPGRAEVTVADRGAAMPSVVPQAASGGHGLVGMRERVGVYGGTLTAGPDESGGWRVHATVGGSP